MRLWPASWLTVAVGLLIANAAMGSEPNATQDPETGEVTVVLTPERAVEQALKRSPGLRALAARVDEERPRAAWHRGLRNPELRLGEFRSNRVLDPDRYSAGGAPLEDAEFGLRWSPPGLDDLGPKQVAAAARVKRREAELSSGATDLEAEVRELYATLRNLDARAELAERQVSLTDEIQKLIARQVEAGVATRLDASMAALDHLDARKDLETLRGERRVVRHRFLARLGLEAPNVKLVLQPPATPWCRSPEQSAIDLETAAVFASSRLREVEAEIDAVDTEIGAAWLGLIPWVDFVQLGYVPGGPNQPDSVHARLSIDVPLLDFNQDDIARLRSRRERHRYEAQAYEERLRARVRWTAEELKGDRALLTLEEEARPMVDESVAVLEAALAAGQADPLELALLRNRVLRAQRARLKAELRCERAFVDLMRMTRPQDGEGASLGGQVSGETG